MKLHNPAMLAGIYGSLTLHEWIDPTLFEEDSYSLFAARAGALGWSQRAQGPYWGMNDAGQSWTGGMASDRVAWFQVGLPEPLIGSGLPVQAVLACAEDVVSRVGFLELGGVQLLLPLHLGSVQLEDLLTQQSWFAAADPAAGSTIRVTVEAGEDGAEIAGRAAAIGETLSGAGAGPVVLDRWSTDPPAAAELAPPVIEDLWWLGDGRHPVTFTGTTVEWSIDAIGYAAALVAWACGERGIATPVAITIDKGRSPHETTSLVDQGQMVAFQDPTTTVCP
jgi:hypothetical protein